MVHSEGDVAATVVARKSKALGRGRPWARYRVWGGSGSRWGALSSREGGAGRRGPWRLVLSAMPRRRGRWGGEGTGGGGGCGSGSGGGARGRRGGRRGGAMGSCSLCHGASAG